MAGVTHKDFETCYVDWTVGNELRVNYPPGTRWGVCLSHDVDHLSLREHFVDGFLVRYVGRSLQHSITQRDGVHALARAVRGIAQTIGGNDPWETLEAVLDAERRAGVRSTWFMVMRPGLGVNYAPMAAARAVKTLIDANQDVALHGQAADDGAALEAEVETLERLLGRPVMGVRMHYLRLTEQAVEAMVKAGIKYDSSGMKRGMRDTRNLDLQGPRWLRPGLIEVPLHVMDSTLFSVTGLGMRLSEAIDYTRQLLRHAADSGGLLVVNLHPNYYSSTSPMIGHWYDWLLSEVTSRSDVFLTDFEGLRSRLVAA
jgi:peptidoglycan/xylan/chitin deacetylase (PgdA/CDA1 family)